MDSASCRMLVTELDTKEILPMRKLVPWFSTSATTKVSSSTGTSPYVSEVNSSTSTMTMAT